MWPCHSRFGFASQRIETCLSYCQPAQVGLVKVGAHPLLVQIGHLHQQLSGFGVL